jgi:hypothetical protein
LKPLVLSPCEATADKMKILQSIVLGSLATVVVASPPLPSYNAPRAGPRFVSSRELQNDISEKA